MLLWRLHEARAIRQPYHNLPQYVGFVSTKPGWLYNFGEKSIIHLKSLQIAGGNHVAGSARFKPTARDLQ